MYAESVAQTDLGPNWYHLNKNFCYDYLDTYFLSLYILEGFLAIG